MSKHEPVVADACVRIAPEAVRLRKGEAIVPGWHGKLRRSILRIGDMVEAAGDVGREVITRGTLTGFRTSREGAAAGNPPSPHAIRRLEPA
jgi:hypothetical protein